MKAKMAVISMAMACINNESESLISNEVTVAVENDIRSNRKPRRRRENISVIIISLKIMAKASKKEIMAASASARV
jgi:hypothetical protein